MRQIRARGVIFSRIPEGVANDVFLRVSIYGSAGKGFSVITIGGCDVQKIVDRVFLQSIKRRLINNPLIFRVHKKERITGLLRLIWLFSVVK